MKIQDLSILTEAKKVVSKSGSTIQPGQKITIINKAMDPGLRELQEKITDLEWSIKNSNRIIKDLKTRLNTATKKQGSLKDPKTSDKATAELQAVVKKIRTECSDYLEIFDKTGMRLYRGFKQASYLAFEGHSRTDREAYDSPQTSQQLFDKASVQLGIKALRSNSVFTSSKENVAEQYGRVYVFFPKNGVPYTWSKTKADIILYADPSFVKMKPLPSSVRKEFEKQKKLLDQLESEAWSEEDSKKKKELDKQISKMYDYVQELENLTEIEDWHSTVDDGETKELLKSLQKINPQSVLLKDPKVIDFLNNPAAIDLKAFQKEFQLTTTDLPKAMQSGHEIWFSGPYIAVRADLWNQMKKDKLI